MKNKTSVRRFIFWFMALMLVAVIGASGVFAWTMHQTQIQNDLRSRTVIVSVKEPQFDSTPWNQGDTRVKQVQFKNEGTATIFLRVAYTESLKNGDAWLDLDPAGVTKNWTAAWSGQWINGGDGWYYYNALLKPGNSTDIVLDSLTFNIPARPDEAVADSVYNLDFTVEAVQASLEADINTEATQTVFGKTGTVANMTIDQATGEIISGTVSWN